MALPARRPYQPPPTVNYGVDISTLPDLDAAFTLVGGQALLKQDLVDRIMTPRGSLRAHRDYGLGLPRFLNGRITPDSLAELESQVEDELQKDARVLSVSCEAMYYRTEERLVLNISITTHAGPMDFSLSLSRANLSTPEVS